MSQNELQKLLYAALASGSDAQQKDIGQSAPDEACIVDAAEHNIISSTPAEIIAHYDFRARKASQMR